MRRTSRKGLLQGLTYCFLGDEMVLIYFFPAQIWGFQNHCPSLSLWGSGQHPLGPWISLNQPSLSRQVGQTPGPGQLTALSAAPKAHTVAAREQIIESCDDMFSPGTRATRVELCIPVPWPGSVIATLMHASGAVTARGGEEVALSQRHYWSSRDSRSGCQLAAWGPDTQPIITPKRITEKGPMHSETCPQELAGPKEAPWSGTQHANSQIPDTGTTSYSVHTAMIQGCP